MDQVRPAPGGASNRFARLERLVGDVLDFIRAVNDSDLTVEIEAEVVIATRRLERDLEGVRIVLKPAGQQ